MKRMCSILAVLLFAALLLIRPQEVSRGVQDGLSLCVRTVVPSLFPFLAVSSLLLRLGLGDALQRPCAVFMGPLFRLRGVCTAPLVTGLLGGYPTGAKSAAELYEQGALTKGEAELLLGFCNNCSPGFLMGFVGAGVLGSTRAGAYLLLIHIAAAILTGVILCHLPRKTEPPPLPCHLPTESISFPRALTDAVSSALSATLGISAYVVLFRTAVTLLGSSIPYGLLAVVEMVSGIALLPPGETGFVAAAVLTAWGGLSVHCQTMSVTGELSLKRHTAGKLLQTILSLLLALIIAPRVYG